MKLPAFARRAVLAACLLWLPCMVHAQTLPAANSPPARPRLLFTASDVPALQARANGGGVPGWAFSQLSTGASFQTASNQASWQVYRSMRFMVEAAVRWRVTGNTGALNSARNLLIRGWPNAIGYLTPTGSNKVYVEATYVGAIAIAFDLLHADLTSAERATIVNELQAWVSSMYVGSAGPGSYGQYSAATDNHSFAWNTAIVMGLLAIWGEPGVNGAAVVSEVNGALSKLNDGYMDVVSPDGSYDENSGYNSYGCMYSLRAQRAAQLCGFPDYVAGTNINRMPRWYGRLLMGDSFHWTGDSSPTHRGVEFDPVLYWLVGREQDEEGFWCLERVRAVQNIDINTSTWAFSAYLSAFLHFPDTMTPAAPEVMSGFFRDNKNLAPGNWPNWNKLNNNPEIGKGGSAWLHNTSDPSWNAFGLHYIIRDEWMSHSHEDDGHVDIVSSGGHLVLDRGYATPGTYANAQSTDHNIVTVNGQSFLGGGTNHFNPPSPDGRYHGTLRGKLLSPKLDYVRGDHGFMWMMERADRSVFLIKDPVAPFAIVLDQVRKTAGTHTYQQRWNTAGPMSGSGTASSPAVISAGGKTVRATWLWPQSVSIVTGAQASAAGTTYHANRVQVTGTGDTTILGLWYPGSLQGSTSLTNPSANARGGIATWASDRIDKIITSIDQNAASDDETLLDGRVGWIRTNQSGAVVAYAAAEATRLIHATSQLLDASEPVTAIVKDGEVWLTRGLLADPAVTPLITLWAPGAVNRVVLDGVDVAFSQGNGIVTVGTPPPPSPPPAPPVTKDRFYTFTGGELLDGRVTGPVLTTHGGIMAVGATGRFEPHDGAAYSAQPLWIGFDVNAGAVSGLIGSLKLSTDANDGDVITIDLYSAPAGGVYVYANHPLVPPSIALVPRVGPQGPTRCAFVIRPTLGTIGFCDRLGQSVGLGILPVCTQAMSVALDMSENVLFDNIGVFDAEEDGTDPQGAAVWLMPNGRFGMAFQAPQVLSASATLSAQGIVLPPPILNLWASQFGMTEMLLLQYAPAGIATPALARELAFETAMPYAVPLDPGIPYVVNGVTATGVTFAAGAWFQP